MTDLSSKERSKLKGIAMNLDPIFQLGKESLTPEFTKAIDEALEKRELIKINVLKNCDDDKQAVAQMLAERTHAQVVQIIGRKIVLFRYQKDAKKRKIEL